jgi:hypothetical protein
MGFAESVRQFLNSFRENSLVVQLRRELDERTHERDYFRGRCELLEMRTAVRPHFAPGKRPDWRETDPNTIVPRGVEVKGGRKTWAQIQAENTEKIRAAQEKAAQEEKEKTKSAN